MPKSIRSIEKRFNRGVIGLVNFMSNLYPESYFGKNESLIENLVEERPEEPIAYFTKYVYSSDEYREKIRDMDESFFINHNYTKVKSRHVQKVFDFKDMWSSMEDDEKKMIKSIMKEFINICDGYVDALARRIEKRKLRNKDAKPRVTYKEEDTDEADYSSEEISLGKQNAV